ncbi:MAG: 50S ribosomal protein L29 [Rhabdochlamydiaceae bacterium]|jgi:large subunit ribosomal protein L29
MAKKTKELRDQSPEELKAIYQDLSKELFELRNEIKVNQKNDKSHQLRAKRKDRARVMTILSEKELAATS